MRVAAAFRAAAGVSPHREQPVATPRNSSWVVLTLSEIAFFSKVYSMIVVGLVLEG